MSAASLAGALSRQAPSAPSVPWWGVSVVAGTFLLVGALIAFTSTALSDRRKLAREDRRQWDKEIRDAFVEISSHVDDIIEYRHLWIEDVDRRTRYEAGSAALAGIRRQQDLLEIIGSAALIVRVAELYAACGHVVAVWHDLVNPPKQAFRDVTAARGELLNTVKSELRMDRYRPYVRQPMSRLTRWKVAVRRRFDGRTD